MSEQAVPDDPCVRAEQWLPDYWQDELGHAVSVRGSIQHLQRVRRVRRIGCTFFGDELGELPKAEADRSETAPALRRDA